MLSSSESDENLRLSSPVFRSEQLVEPFEQVHVRARGVLLSDFAHLRALVLFGLVFVSGHVVSKVQLCEFTRRDTAEGEKRGGKDWFIHEFEYCDE